VEEYPVIIKSNGENKLFVLVSGETLEISVFLAKLWSGNNGFALFFDKNAGMVRILLPES